MLLLVLLVLVLVLVLVLLLLLLLLVLLLLLLEPQKNPESSAPDSISFFTQRRHVDALIHSTQHELPEMSTEFLINETPALHGRPNLSMPSGLMGFNAFISCSHSQQIWAQRREGFPGWPAFLVLQAIDRAEGSG